MSIYQHLKQKLCLKVLGYSRFKILKENNFEKITEGS